MKKRVVSLFLTLFLLVGVLPMTAMAAGTGYGPQNVGEGDVTRAEWIQSLVAAFSMTVEEDNYPDNYYSDITEADPYYRDIMIAVEFGVIDLEAGLPFEPEAAATREFAVQTLNYSLGYQLAEGTEYTFAEAAEVAHPDDIQVAIQRGWFQLVGDAFMPQQPVTTAEKDAMMADVAAVLAGDVIDPDYQSTATVSHGVIEVPNGTEVKFLQEDVIQIVGNSVQIAGNDLFVVYYHGIPMAFRALKVEPSPLGTVITVTTEGTEDALVDYDYEGTVEASLEDFEGSGAETFVLGDQIVHTSATTHGIEYDDDKKVLTATKTIELGKGIEAEISAEIADLQFDLKAKLIKGDYRCIVKGDATLSTNVSVDVLEALGQAKTIELGRVPIYGVGYVKLSAEFSLSGEMSLVWSGDVQAGFTYKRSEGFRVVRSFKKESFTFMAEVTLKSGLRLDAGVDVLVFDANIWAKIGAQMNVKKMVYDTGSPSDCLDMDGYMYASVGVNGSIIKVIDFSESYDIYTRSNSPIRAHYHYEEDVWVSSCTRGKTSDGTTSSDYYTQPDSKNFTPGFSKGSSSYTDADGEEHVIYTYTLNSKNEATITGYTGIASALNIPSTIDGYPVVRIGDKAFNYIDTLRAVKFPNTVISIGSKAFLGCQNLATVTLPRNLEKLGREAFGDCVSIRSIWIPKSLTDGGNSYDNISDSGAFAGCDNLKEVIFEEGITQIPAALFARCDGLEEIVIPDTVTSIGAIAFGHASSLRSVKLPEGLTKIGEGAFGTCTSLTEIEIPDTVTTISLHAFSYCSNLSKVTLSKNLEKLGREAFEDCVSIRSIWIPKSLTDGGNSYENISDSGAFAGCDNLKEVIFEEGITQIPAALFARCDGLEEIVIPDTVTSIGAIAFGHASSLRSVKLPEGLTKIGERAFGTCTSLTEIEIPDTVTTISLHAFSYCSNLSKVTLSKNLEKLGREAFEDCVSIRSIWIPKSLTDGGNSYNNISDSGAFAGCANLKEVIFEEGITQIPAALFARCNGLEEIVIPDTVESIGAIAFGNASSLRKVTLLHGVTKIKDKAFQLCKALEKIVIPASVTSIANTAFNTPDVTVIYGIAGSYAQTWATEKGYQFVAYEAHAEAVTLNQTELALHVGDSAALQATITPIDCTDVVRWESDAPAVATVTENGVVTAVAAGTATITVRVGELSAECQVTVSEKLPEFEDVPEGAWYEEHVAWAVAKGITTGAGSATTFLPDKTCSRAEIVTFLWRAYGSPEPVTTENPFVDIDPVNDAWFFKPVLWAVENGITTGTGNGKFNPFGECSRAEVVTFLWRAAGKPEPTSPDNPFVDVDPVEGSWYYKPVLWAVEEGITTGVGNGMFKPMNKCSRAEIVTFLHRAME